MLNVGVILRKLVMSCRVFAGVAISFSYWMVCIVRCGSSWRLVVDVRSAW